MSTNAHKRHKVSKTKQQREELIVATGALRATSKAYRALNTLGTHDTARRPQARSSAHRQAQAQRQRMDRGVAKAIKRSSRHQRWYEDAV